MIGNIVKYYSGCDDPNGVIKASDSSRTYRFNLTNIDDNELKNRLTSQHWKEICGVSVEFSPSVWINGSGKKSDIAKNVRLSSCEIQASEGAVDAFASADAVAERDVFQSEPRAEVAVRSTNKNKQLLSVENQISHMKSLGITFDRVPEDEAANYLLLDSNYFRIRSFRGDFSKEFVDGEVRYRNLDFSDLKDMEQFD